MNQCASLVDNLRSVTRWGCAPLAPAEATFQAKAEMREQESVRKFMLTMFVLYLWYKKRGLSVQKCSGEQNSLSLKQNQEVHLWTNEPLCEFK